MKLLISVATADLTVSVTGSVSLDIYGEKGQFIMKTKVCPQTSKLFLENCTKCIEVTRVYLIPWEGWGKMYSEMETTEMCYVTVLIQRV